MKRLRTVGAGLTIPARVSLALTEQAVLGPGPAPGAELGDVAPGVVRDVAGVHSPCYYK